MPRQFRATRALRDIRLYRNLSIEDLARAAFIDSRRLAEIEAGDAVTRPESLLLANVLKQPHVLLFVAEPLTFKQFIRFILIGVGVLVFATILGVAGLFVLLNYLHNQPADHTTVHLPKLTYAATRLLA